MANYIIMMVLLTVFSFTAYLVGALKKSGAFAAIFVGLSIYLGTGLKGLILLAIFFISSTFWSRFKQNEKQSAAEMGEKDDQRDWAQVLANGGVPAIASILFYFQNEPIWLLTFTIALAGANADTWASEIGVLSKNNPINVFTMRRVERGSSGAISILGTVAAFIASLLIGVAAFVLWNDVLTLESIAIAIIFGFISMLTDTILGITIQRKNRCMVCGKVTEKTIHCGKQTELFSGLKWINNDAVNIISVFLISLLGTLFLIS